MKYLIVNADDFGLSTGVNEGIIEAFEHGIVTSSSLMVRQAAAAEAAEYSRDHPILSIGLHVDLGEWIYCNGNWVASYEVVPLDDATSVRAEIYRQLMMFRDLLKRDPTHLDSHQHVHNQEPVRSILLAIGRQLSIPVRQLGPSIRYCGDFYGQNGKGEPFTEAITANKLLAILASLAHSVTELGCHPGKGDSIPSIYQLERAKEVTVLCDPRVRAAVIAEGIELRSFSNIVSLQEDYAPFYTGK